jgi:hypothetical protein
MPPATRTRAVDTWLGGRATYLVLGQVMSTLWSAISIGLPSTLPTGDRASEVNWADRTVRHPAISRLLPADGRLSLWLGNGKLSTLEPSPQLASQADPEPRDSFAVVDP